MEGRIGKDDAAFAIERGMSTRNGKELGTPRERWAMPMGMAAGLEKFLLKRNSVPRVRNLSVEKFLIPPLVKILQKGSKFLK